VAGLREDAPTALGERLTQLKYPFSLKTHQRGMLISARDRNVTHAD
jgi:hypothetical protein